jgi:Uma2 family endonuclease
MATAPPLLSIEEYLHTSYKPDVHFVDGEIEERNVGEYDHAKLQSLILVLFANHEDQWQTDAIVEQRIRIGTSRVRICDIAVLRADAPHEDVTTTPPLICIEIMSPEDSLSRAEKVLADYFAMGVPNIWLIDPYKRVSYTYGPHGLSSADPADLSVPGTPIHLDVTSLFARLDEKINARKPL